MIGFVYIWFDRKHKMYYIGSHVGCPLDGYVCSSKWMLNAYAKRPQDFRRKIISTIGGTDKTSVLTEEQRWLNYISTNQLGVKYYNLNNKVFGFHGKQLDATAKNKQSLAKIGKYDGEKNPFFGKRHTPEAIQRMSDAKRGSMIGKDNHFYGRQHTDEAKKIIADKLKGKPRERELIERAVSCRKNKIKNSQSVGVSWNSSRQKWIARIKHEGKAIFLGYFSIFEEAVAARKQAETTIW